MLAILLRKGSNFLSQPPFVRLWLIPIWCLLGIGKCLTYIVTFRRLAPYLGHSMGAAPWVPLLEPEQEARARQICRVITFTARYTPWDSNCFPQAVAARVLLGLYGVPYVLYFGLMRDTVSAELKAHTWVASGKVRVTGGGSFRKFTVVGVFVSPALISA